MAVTTRASVKRRGSACGFYGRHRFSLVHIPFGAKTQPPRRNCQVSRLVSQQRSSFRAHCKTAIFLDPYRIACFPPASISYSPRKGCLRSGLSQVQQERGNIVRGRVVAGCRASVRVDSNERGTAACRGTRNHVYPLRLTPGRMNRAGFL